MILMSRNIQRVNYVPNLKDLFFYEVMIVNKWAWFTFDCKVSQSDPTAMKCKLDMSVDLLNIFAEFEINISKHVETG